MPLPPWLCRLPARLAAQPIADTPPPRCSLLLLGLQDLQCTVPLIGSLRTCTPILSIPPSPARHNDGPAGRDQPSSALQRPSFQATDRRAGRSREKWKVCGMPQKALGRPAAHRSPSVHTARARTDIDAGANSNYSSEMHANSVAMRLVKGTEKICRLGRPLFGSLQSQGIAAKWVAPPCSPELLCRPLHRLRWSPSRC